MATLHDMLAEQARITAELQRMEDDPNITEEKDGALRDTLVARWKELDEESKPIIARMEEIKNITRTAAKPENRESGDGGVQRMQGSAGPEFMVRKDPLADREETQDYKMLRTGDVIARASTLAEQHNKRGYLGHDRAERVTALVSRSEYAPSIARHCLLYGGDEYYDAFTEYVNDPRGRGLQRAAGALSLSSAQGGFLLPYFLDPTIVLSTDGTTNPYRRLGNVKQITTNAYQGVNSAGVQAAFLDEATAASTANFQGIGQIQIFVKKAAAWVWGSLEANEDTNFADQLPGLIQDAKDVLEESKYAVGTGGTNNAGEPTGIVSSLGTGATQRVNAQASGAIAATDIYNLEAALGPRFRRSNSVGWTANITTINKIRNASPSGAGSSFWATLGDGTPSRLLNHVIEESPSVTATAGTGTASSGTASAQVVFGAWDNFLVVDRIGMSMIFETMITGTGASANVPTGQQGWYAFWRTGSGVTTSNAFRWLQYSTG